MNTKNRSVLISAFIFLFLFSAGLPLRPEASEKHSLLQNYWRWEEDDWEDEDGRSLRGGPGFEDVPYGYGDGWDFYRAAYPEDSSFYSGPGFEGQDGLGPGSGSLKDAGNPRNALAGQWIHDASGWWYRYLNGGWPVSSWQLIHNRWYYFNSQGYLQTGWFQLDGSWYYSFEDGARAMGWQKIGPYWYYFTETGEMASGWTLVGSSRYYLDPVSGAMWAGCFTPDGHYVNEDGVQLY